MMISLSRESFNLDRSFEIAGANDAMRYMRGEVQPLQVAGLGAYLKSMTPALWQSIGPTIEAITPLLTKNEAAEPPEFVDYYMA